MPKTQVDMNAAKELAIDASKKLNALWEALGKPKDPLNRFQNVTFLDLLDEVGNIKYEVIARSDGRPKPLDFSAGYRHAKEELDAMSAEIREERGEYVKQLERWAECADRGYDTKAYLRDCPMSESQLITLRNWIDEVLSWHSAKVRPKSKRK